MKQIIKNRTFDEERALYNLTDVRVEDCIFEGEADGESAFKEARHIEVANCRMALRYPFWHAEDFSVSNCTFTPTARAAVWYAKCGYFENCILDGIKVFRECDDITVKNCRSVSPEAFWKCRDFRIDSSSFDGEYLFFESENGIIENLEMKGKYSFQYIKNLTIRNSVLDTKDAFWHAENVTVENCTVKGEYAAWYSKNVTFRNCRISGTQPFCYCEGLVLENCTMEETDLSFEYSHVTADIKGHILSVKNPASGIIRADSIGEIILENSVVESKCEIITGENAV